MTPPFLRTSAVIAALLALTPSGHAQPHKAKSHKAPSARAGHAGAWQPNAALLKQLAPEVSLGDYWVRPPQGYEFNVDTREGDKEMLSVSHWTSEKRPDNSQAELWVFIGSPKPGYHPDSAQKQMDGFQTMIQEHLHDITESPTEEGSIHNTSFTRLYWKGTGTDTETKLPEHVHGFTYKAVDSFTIITIMAADSEPYSQTTLPLLEAAAETFHPQ